MFEPDHALWWHVYPLGAVGAPIRNRVADDDGGDRLRRLEAWLDYAVELGCSGLLLGPVFESTSHGYDTVDYFLLDRRLGGEEDWAWFVEQTGRRGLSLVLDGVFNHVGVHHPLVRRALEEDGGMVLLDRTGDRPRPQPWEGNADLALLDHADPRVADLVVDVMLHWLRRGAAGWRLDVAYAVPPDFWRAVLGRVRAEFPRAFFLGEVIRGDYPAIARAGTLDSVTQYELWKAIWSSIGARNMWELAWALERHDGFGQDLLTQTFVGNHDVGRIATQVGASGAVLAHALLLTLPGLPSIYYGDEQGFRGAKREGFVADDDLRPALPPAPAELAPDGWWIHSLVRDLVALRRRHPWLTRGRVHGVTKDNGWIDYEVTGGGGSLRVRLTLEPPSVTVTTADGDGFRWAEPG